MAVPTVDQLLQSTLDARPHGLSDEEILERLLVLNMERALSGGSSAQLAAE